MLLCTRNLLPTHMPATENECGGTARITGPTSQIEAHMDQEEDEHEKK